MLTDGPAGTKTDGPLVACLGGGAVGFAVLSRLSDLGISCVLFTRRGVYRQAFDSERGSVLVSPSAASEGSERVATAATVEMVGRRAKGIGDRDNIQQGKEDKAVVHVHSFGGVHSFASGPASLAEGLWPQVDVVFVTVQTYHLQSALEDLAPKLSPSAVVISLCNGRCDGILQRFQQTYPQLTVRLGVAFFNSTAVSDGEYRCSANPYIVWGPLFGGHDVAGADRTWAEQYVLDTETQQMSQSKTSLFFRLLPSVLESYQRKWVLNTVGNSLSAAYRIRDACGLLDDPDRLDETLDQTYALAQRMWGEVPFSKESVKEQLYGFLKHFGDLEISMHRHVREGVRTETDYLAGCAEEYAPEFPLLRELHTRITSYGRDGK